MVKKGVAEQHLWCQGFCSEIKATKESTSETEQTANRTSLALADKVSAKMGEIQKKAARSKADPNGLHSEHLIAGKRAAQEKQPIPSANPKQPRLEAARPPILALEAPR